VKESVETVDFKEHPEVAHVGGVPFLVTTLKDAAQRMVDMARSNEPPASFRLANAYSTVAANSDPKYLSLLRGNGINLPDGTPVVACMRIFEGFKDAGRVRGPSFFLKTIELGLDDNIRHFFLGTNDATLAKLEENLRAEYPSIRIAGSYAPPYMSLDSGLLNNCLDGISGTKSDIIWVGLGSPKQDFIASALASALAVPTAGVGAAFDFAARTVPEAPKWVQTIGMEWFFRLLTDPRRLWRRYLIGNAKFIHLVVSFALKRKVFQGENAEF
jgi:N-acetylglucosaminyldiphosphoundecaprenol N-acetyl-beta-D-mannosaminyltransferase